MEIMSLREKKRRNCNGLWKKLIKMYETWRGWGKRMDF